MIHTCIQKDRHITAKLFCKNGLDRHKYMIFTVKYTAIQVHFIRQLVLLCSHTHTTCAHTNTHTHIYIHTHTHIYAHTSVLFCLSIALYGPCGLPKEERTKKSTSILPCTPPVHTMETGGSIACKSNSSIQTVVIKLIHLSCFMFLVSAIFKGNSEIMLIVCEVTSYNHAQYPVLIRKLSCNDMHL